MSSHELTYYTDYVLCVYELETDPLGNQVRFRIIKRPFERSGQNLDDHDTPLGEMISLSLDDHDKPFEGSHQSQ